MTRRAGQDGRQNSGHATAWFVSRSRGSTPLNRGPYPQTKSPGQEGHGKRKILIDPGREFEISSVYRPLKEKPMPAPKEGTFPLPTRAPRVCKTMPITLWELSNARSRRWPGAILDLSDHGLRIATGTTLRRGQMVSIFLNDTGLCFKRCRVIWTRSLPVPQLSQAGLEVLK